MNKAASGNMNLGGSLTRQVCISILKRVLANILINFKLFVLNMLCDYKKDAQSQYVIPLYPENVDKNASVKHPLFYKCHLCVIMRCLHDRLLE